MVEGAAMLPSVAVALWFRGDDWKWLLLAAAMAAACGCALNFFMRPNSKTLRAREGFLTVALSWVALSLFGCLPFLMGGYIPYFPDAFFECVSGYTTTGSTILTDIESLPKGILFWRSFTHWIGGMGVLVLALAILPSSGNTLYLLKAESPGPTPGKLVPRIGKTAKLLYGFYIVLTVMQVIALLFCGMNWYDALIHTFGTAGTGGFSNYAASVGHFQSAAVDNVMSLFLFLFSVNFSMYFLLWHREFKQVFRNEELLTFAGIVLVATGIISLNILPIYGTVLKSLRYGVFQVLSIISTAGFSTADFNLWPQLSRTVLIILMLIGACAGSTGGGLKVVRISVLVKSLKRSLHSAVHPRAVSVLRMDDKTLDEGIVNQVVNFFGAYILVIIVSTLLVSVDGLDFETNLTASISAIGNVGPGLSLAGPMGSFAMFSGFSKIVLSFCMLIGRLEIWPMLLLFSPSGWRNK